MRIVLECTQPNLFVDVVNEGAFAAPAASAAAGVRVGTRARSGACGAGAGSSSGGLGREAGNVHGVVALCAGTTHAMQSASRTCEKPSVGGMGGRKGHGLTEHEEQVLYVEHWAAAVTRQQAGARNHALEELVRRLQQELRAPMLPGYI